MEFFECLFCKENYPADLFNPFCPDCHEPLLYHFPRKKRDFSLGKAHYLDQYSDFLPLSKINRNIYLGEGATPLIKLNRLVKKYKLPLVFVKNEIFNPTGSFKDRGTTVAVQKAISSGIRRIGTVSTGNMASSTAAFGAKAGLETFLLVKEDTSSEKVLSAGIHNPVIIKVEGDYGSLFYKSFSLGKKYNIYFMNSVDPFRIEGYKVTGFEIYLQSNHQAPRYIFVPLSSGGHLIGLMRSFINLKEQGMIQQLPTFVGVQAQGCSPIAHAFSSGSLKVKRILKSRTIAHAISNPDPPGGNISLKFIRENDGLIIDVSDEEMLASQRALAEIEGIFCQPASATAFAGLMKLSQKIKFSLDDLIVLVITGSGLKALKTLNAKRMNIYHSSLNRLENMLDSLVLSF